MKYLTLGTECEDCGQQISEHDWMIHEAIVKMHRERQAGFGTGAKE